MKHKNIIIVIVIAVIVLGGLVWIARPDGKNTNTGASSATVMPGALAAEVTDFDFGTISMAKGTVSRIVAVRNAGAGTVTIGKMYTSCMCTTASLMLRGERFGPYGMPGHGFVPTINKEIGAGEEAAVEIIFDPAAHGPSGVGRIERVVIIENDGGTPLQVGFTANVTP